MSGDKNIMKDVQETEMDDRDMTEETSKNDSADSGQESGTAGLVEEQESIFRDHEDDVLAEEQRKENAVVMKQRVRKTGKMILEIILYLVIIVFCINFIPKYVVQRTIVDGNSMLNTLKNEENVLVEKVSYRFKDPDRFDIIVFYPHGRQSSDYYIKRIIGLPGETVQIIGDTIYIDGEKLEENFGKDPITYQGIAAEPVTLEEDEFFVLGDNRKISEDSRYEHIGPVKKENIAGKAVLRIYPFDKFGAID